MYMWSYITGNIEVILRTSDRRRFPGFRATITCFQVQNDDDDDDNGDGI